MSRRIDANRNLWLPLLLLAFLVLTMLHPDAARATTTGGSLPWDTPLTTLRNDITGPVAFTISLLAMVAAGAALVFGGEINEFVRRIIMLVLVASFIVGVTNLASALGIAGAMV
jgi:type IV secretory pathway VirB2 component (pilin)